MHPDGASSLSRLRVLRNMGLRFSLWHCADAGPWFIGLPVNVCPSRCFECCPRGKPGRILLLEMGPCGLPLRVRVLERLMITRFCEPGSVVVGFGVLGCYWMGVVGGFICLVWWCGPFEALEGSGKVAIVLSTHSSLAAPHHSHLFRRLDTTVSWHTH